MSKKEAVNKVNDALSDLAKQQLAFEAQQQNGKDQLKSLPEDPSQKDESQTQESGPLELDSFNPGLNIKEQLEKMKQDGQLEKLTQYAAQRYTDPAIFQTLKERRREVDSLYLTLEHLRNYFPVQMGRYISLAVTGLQSARHFLGIMLREKGDTKDKAATYPDKGEVLDSAAIGATVGTRLANLREFTQDQIIAMTHFLDQYQHVGMLDFVAQNAVLAKLMEAKCWLGEALAMCEEK